MTAFIQKDERLQHLRKIQLRSLGQKGIKSFRLEICIYCWLLIRTVVQCQGKVRLPSALFLVETKKKI